ncbi:MAG: arginine repressor [Clostridia bacterium]|jgi:transcriptional regulator of arginine metabolism|nr:arginine repressor [Clostridiaceae bacterium]
MKEKRHSAIIEIVQKYEIETQTELADILNRHGFEVTQATVSRDIKDLGLTKIPTPSGKYIYALLPDGKSDPSVGRNTVLKEAFVNMDKTGNLIVLKTKPGMAQAVASIIDSIEDKDKLGTIAGDDTLLIICRTDEACNRIYNELAGMVS